MHNDRGQPRVMPLAGERGFGVISFLWCELVDGHADVVENASQRSFGHVAVAVDRHGGAAPVRVAHDVVAAADPGDLEAVALQRPDYSDARE